MILRRLFTLIALTVAASLSLSDRAHASYDTSVSVASVTGTGVLLNVPGTVAGQGTVSFTNTNLLPVGTQLTPAGYFAFTDGGGSTVYLVNQVLIGVSGTSGVNESLYVATPAGVVDNSTWTVNLLVSVTNPSSVPGPAGGTGQFGGTGSIAESVTYTVSSTAPGTTPASGSYGTLALPTFTSPTTIIVGPNSFTLGLPGGATGGNVNQTQNNGGISGTITTGAIPEPASVVMLGAGLVGVVGLSLWRKKKQD
jgi:hypothetical protein